MSGTQVFKSPEDDCFCDEVSRQLAFWKPYDDGREGGRGPEYDHRLTLPAAGGADLRPGDVYCCCERLAPGCDRSDRLRLAEVSLH